MTPTPPRRLFVALWPPATFVAEVATALAEVRRTAPPTLKWQPPERWHITVLFLGDSSLRRAEKAVTTVAAATASGPVTCSGAGHFGRALWWGTEAPWAGDIPQRLSQLTGRRADHPWRPHLTLARSRGAPIPPEVLRAVGALPARRWNADRLVLVDSTIGPAPHYEPLVEAPLAG